MEMHSAACSLVCYRPSAECAAFTCAAVKREDDDEEDVEQTGTVEDAAAAAIAAQPTGFTLATTNVQTEVTDVPT